MKGEKLPVGWECCECGLVIIRATQESCRDAVDRHAKMHLAAFARVKARKRTAAAFLTLAAVACAVLPLALY